MSMTKILFPVKHGQHFHSFVFLYRLTLISLKPALSSRSFADRTAWKGVGDALTNLRNSVAAFSVLGAVMVQ